jgi:hypothetical protein
MAYLRSAVSLVVRVEVRSGGHAAVGAVAVLVHMEAVESRREAGDLALHRRRLALLCLMRTASVEEALADCWKGCLHSLVLDNNLNDSSQMRYSPA